MAQFDIDRSRHAEGAFRPSDYTIALGADRLFNSVTGAMLVMSPAQQAEFDHIASHHDFADRAVAEDLHSWGFIVPSQMRELKVLEAAWHTAVGADKPPLLTIAPTMNCNFGCDYCFETHEKGHMPPAVRAGLVSLVRERFAAKGPVPLSVTWFGGEPLMGLPVILDLSERFDALVREGVLSSWSASIITNGLLATPKVMTQLRNLTQIQVTIDGPRDIHDERRILKHGGKPTFDRICANLAILPEALPTLIRVNVDRRNADYLELCAEQLLTAGVLARPEATIYLGIVESYESASATEPGRGAGRANLLSTREFAAIQQRFVAHCRARGINVAADRPAPVLRGVCQVDNVNAYVVDPRGALMKCWAELRNNPDTVANLLDPESWQDPDLSRLEMRDPFDDQGCRDCRLLPLCMGGCPKTRAVNRTDGRKVCPPVSYNLGTALKEALPGLETGIPAYVAAPNLLRMTK